MRRLAASLTVLALVATACGGSDDDPVVVISLQDAVTSSKSFEHKKWWIALSQASPVYLFCVEAPKTMHPYESDSTSVLPQKYWDGGSLV